MSHVLQLYNKKNECFFCFNRKWLAILQKILDQEQFLREHHRKEFFLLQLILKLFFALPIYLVSLAQAYDWQYQKPMLNREKYLHMVEYCREKCTCLALHTKRIELFLIFWRFFFTFPLQIINYSCSHTKSIIILIVLLFNLLVTAFLNVKNKI